MKLFNQQANGAFSARGICPHCTIASLQLPVPSPTLVVLSDSLTSESNALLQCQNCFGVTLVVAARDNRTAVVTYKENHPVENPETSTDKTIPPGVRDDYVEALRCRSVGAHKASVVMCRRSLQSSCKNLGAEGPNLIRQIDDLAVKGTITAALKNMAHEIRKLGNEGAHPDEDGLGDVGKEDADDIIEFTRQYFEHVYVMPARSDTFKKRREAAAGSEKKA
jgi:Domain of unknown function (DUF4145)